MGSSSFRRSSRCITLGSYSLLLASAFALTPSCLNRPVTPSEPETSNRFVEQVRYTSIDKIDLLFVVDNSVSMADKQQILKQAVPSMLRRLVDPPCVNDSGDSQPALPGAEPECPAGFEREFQPIEDIHIGVITSSLGSRGPSRCAPESGHEDDRGLLLPSVRPGLPSWNSTGYLLWDPHAKYSPPGTADLDQLSADFAATIESVHDDGCGFESTLEAWYRFLIDPEPALSVQVDASTGQNTPEGIDQDVLSQRAAFLRPDSLLGIVMLSDEDDCSISDRGFGWLLSDESRSRPRPTSACASDPESSCCRPCTSTESAPPAGCTSIADDPACSPAEYPPANSDEDRRNLRCFDQKRRFGMEFLHPVQRYVDGLQQALVPNRAGELVQNPLFTASVGKAGRDKTLVFLGGILGVPWPDVASDASRSGDGLDYLSNKQLSDAKRWDLILGRPHSEVAAERLPTDALMIPSPAPRSGVHPLLGVPLAPETSIDPGENPLNGHEYANIDDSDLQYACIFPLETPVECTQGVNCDCHEEDLQRNRPLCQPREGGAARTTQYFAKGYPGRRLLEVLNGIGDQGIVASICPKLALGDASAPSYGYNPALAAVVDIITPQLARCLPRPLEVTAEGGVPCRVAEATRGACDCSLLAGRKAVTDSELESAVQSELAAHGQCGGESGVPCSDFCVCEIEQLGGEAQSTCQNDVATGEQSPGYCYIDADHTDASGMKAPIGNPELVGGCPPGHRRNLRFVGENTPQNGAVTFIACTGAPVSGVE